MKIWPFKNSGTKKSSTVVCCQCIDNKADGYHFIFGYWQSDHSDDENITLKEAKEIAKKKLNDDPVDFYNLLDRIDKGIHLDLRHQVIILARKKRASWNKRYAKMNTLHSRTFTAVD